MYQRNKLESIVCLLKSYDFVVCVSHSVISDSLWLHELYPTRLLCPWNSPGRNTVEGSHSLLHGIFLIHGLRLGWNITSFYFFLLICVSVPNYHFSFKWNKYFLVSYFIWLIDFLDLFIFYMLVAVLDNRASTFKLLSYSKNNQHPEQCKKLTSI